MIKDLNFSAEGLTPNQKLQTIYQSINSGDDYYFIRHGLRSLLWLKNNGYELITSCDIWECLENMKITPQNPRSMGLIVKLGAKNNLIENTGQYRPSRRKQANQRPVRIWRLI